MRPLEEVKRELVKQWLAKAEEDFAVARHLLATGTAYYGAIGFHAQQGAEKFLKAFLVWRQVEFPKTHDLGELLELVGKIDEPLAATLEGAVALNPYGVEVRYHADFTAISPEEAQ